MVKKITMRKIGGSIGTTLPKDMLDRLRIEPGDEMYVVETEEGILLTPFDPKFGEAMKAYDRFSRKYRNALRELAK
ncbi:MAG: AbrB/MazE/SpoVT family DNA-binding domain-containing protein [Gemmatimonadota bacterium]|nr:AbrB/MazE/SpoVT family DNA-binding domain-containing protein [Gemmatimonadota bacterium]